MPKYIRTKDGIYEFDELNEKNLNSNVIDIYNCLGLETQIRKCDIIKQGDTIEELCDGFYIDKCKEEFLYDEIFDECWYDFNPYFKACAKNGIDVFGFIKTSKGLIYVAKMGNDGKLVLI